MPNEHQTTTTTPQQRIGTKLSGRFQQESWNTVERILEYFDSYKLGSAAPIATEIEIILEHAYEAGKAGA